MKELSARAHYDFADVGRVAVWVRDTEVSITPRQARLLAARLLVEADRAERNHARMSKRVDLARKIKALKSNEGVRELMVSMLTGREA